MKQAWTVRHHTLGTLPNNIRFYVLVTTGLFSLLVISYLRTHIPSEQLFYIRSEQVCGYIAVGFWYLALLATPLSKVVGKTGWMAQWLFARRSLGVSAAYFALLHAGIGLFGQIGGWNGIGVLPASFEQSLLWGLSGLIILSAMALTSFDKVIAFMTFPRWKWLHRLGYLGGVLVILHLWVIGTHTSYAWLRWGGFVALSILFALESFRVAQLLGEKYIGLRHRDMLITIGVCMWLVLSGALLVLPRITQTYHASHHTHAVERGGHE